MPIKEKVRQFSRKGTCHVPAVVATGRGAAPRAPAPSGSTPRPAPPPHVVARPSQSSQTNGTVTAPRGQWGDDGYDAYGVGQHRGSSSSGGGRGYAWQSDGSIERPFLGPAGGFVEGSSDPGHRQRGGYRGHRGGRGGRGGRYRPRQPPPPVVVEQMSDSGAAEEPVLSNHAMEVVTALASAPVPEVMSNVSAEIMDRVDSDRASKWARRKEKMLCYRCGDKGHFIAECVARLCDTCGKLAHESGECPLLRDQAPSLKMYGVYCAELTFFESPTEPEVPAESPSLTTGIVKVTRGEVSEAQIVQRLRELAPGEFQWDLVGLADKMFRVECPSVEDLQRLLSFGMCKVPGTDGILEFQEWKIVEPQGVPLTQAWLRFSGAPSSPLQDARVVASLGILLGKPERVDMAFTRAHGIARVLVSILNVEYVPEVVKWAYRGRIYNLVIEFEDESLLSAPDHTSDVDMHEGDGNAGVQEPPAEDSGRQLSMGPGSETAMTGDGATQPSSVPSQSLRFGSFQPFSAPPRLWSDRVESEEAFELALPALDFMDALDSGFGALGASPLLVRGAEEVSRPVATPSSGQRMVPPMEMPQSTGSRVQGGVIDQAVSGSFCAEDGEAGQVAPVYSSTLGGGLGQEDLDTSSPVVISSRTVSTSPSGVGSGQVASVLAPMVAASPVQVGESGREVLAMSPPPSVMPSSGGPCQASLTPTGAPVGRPG